MGANGKLTSWSIADAKARFSEVVERAGTEPQMITRNGKPAAVLVSPEEWGRKTDRKGSLAEFLLASPLHGSEIDIERSREMPRDVKL